MNPLADAARPAPRLAAPRARHITDLAFLVYLLSYALEGPIRYALDGIHADGLILLRDALLDGSLSVVILAELADGRVPMSFAVLSPVLLLGVLVAWGSGVAPVSWALGAKTFVNLLFGAVVPQAVMRIGERRPRLVLGLLLVSVLALFAEKFVVAFPWVGLHATIGGVQVELSRDWQIDDTFNKRVGGLTKVSISAANVVSLLTLLAVAGRRARLSGLAIAAIGIAGVFLTTQKGALLGLILVCAASVVPLVRRVKLLAALTVLGLVVDIGLPYVTDGLQVSEGNNGPFSASSIGDRIVTTWPTTRAWIASHGTFPFGLGVGGVGQAESYGTAIAAHYPDNLFLFLLGSFGLVAWLFPPVVLGAVFCASSLQPVRAARALGILAFLLIDGTFITIVEDPLGAMFLGATVAMLIGGAARARSGVRAPIGGAVAAGARS